MERKVFRSFRRQEEGHGGASTPRRTTLHNDSADRKFTYCLLIPDSASVG